MVDPEIQIINTEINTDHAKDSESVMVYPDLLKFLKQNQWRQMSGHSCTEQYIKNFRSRLEIDADFFSCKVDITENVVKLTLLEPIESHIMMLKVPDLEEKVKNKISAENLENTLKRKVLCLTPGFQIVEPTQMVEGVPRRGFIILPRGCPLPEGPAELRDDQGRLQAVAVRSNPVPLRFPGPRRILIQRGNRLIPFVPRSPPVQQSQPVPRLPPHLRSRPVPRSQPDGTGKLNFSR